MNKRIIEAELRTIEAISGSLSICPECSRKSLRITPKGIKFCFVCDKDIGEVKEND